MSLETKGKQTSWRDIRDFGWDISGAPDKFERKKVFGDLKITSTSTERQKRSQNLAPVLVIISGKSLVFPRKIITSTDFYGCNDFPRKCQRVPLNYYSVVVNFVEISSPFLVRQKERKRIFLFFPVGRPRPEPSPKPSPCRLPFLY